jgi:hypothetical protein
VTQPAKPHNLQRLGVIGMVSVWLALLVAAGTFGWANDAAFFYGGVEKNASGVFYVLTFLLPVFFVIGSAVLISPTLTKFPSKLADLFPIVGSIAPIALAYLFFVRLPVISVSLCIFREMFESVFLLILSAGFWVFEWHKSAFYNTWRNVSIISCANWRIA